MSAPAQPMDDTPTDKSIGDPAWVEDARWHRLSPRMLLVHPIIEIGRALPALLGVFLAGSTQGHHYWGLIGAGVVAALAVSRWFTTRLRVTPQQLQLRQGLLRRRTITTARDRVRTVDVTSHLLHRVLGLARVVVGTGTNDRKHEARIVLDGLSMPVADALRDDLLHHQPTDRSAAVPTGRSAELELARLDRRWIRYAPLSLSGAVTGLIVFGFVWRVQGESGLDLTGAGPLRRLADRLRDLPAVTATVLIALAVLAFVAVASTIGYVLAFWNFRLRRHDGGTLEITRGLLTTRATSIERRRLLGVQIIEPILLRAVGAVRTVAIATGLRTGRGAERGGEVLLPPAPRAVAEGVAALVLDGTSAITAAVRSHGPAARRRRLVRAVAGGLLVPAGCLVGVLAGADPWLPVIGLVAVPASVALGRDRYASLGHAVVDGYLISRNGSLVRRRSVLDAEAVIGWNLRSTFFQRRQGLLTLTATTAGGRQGYPVCDIEAGAAVQLAEVVVPGLLTQFRATRPSGPPAGVELWSAGPDRNPAR